MILTLSLFVIKDLRANLVSELKNYFIHETNHDVLLIIDDVNTSLSLLVIIHRNSFMLQFVN